MKTQTWGTKGEIGWLGGFALLDFALVFASAWLFDGIVDVRFRSLWAVGLMFALVCVVLSLFRPALESSIFTLCLITAFVPTFMGGLLCPASFPWPSPFASNPGTAAWYALQAAGSLVLVYVLAFKWPQTMARCHEKR